MPNGFQIVNADPREWPEWDALVTCAEVRMARQLFCDGEYYEYLNRQDLSGEGFRDRLLVLATVWGGEIVSG